MHTSPIIHPLNGIKETETADPLLSKGESIQSPRPTEFLIVDCSAVSYIDLTGSNFLAALLYDLEKEGVSLLLAGCSAHVIEELDHCEAFDKIPKKVIYPTVIDAVISVQNTSHTEDQLMDSALKV